jgi:Tol biopolymer transport system component
VFDVLARVRAGPSPSPDGTKIAWRNDRTGNFDVCVMNADGSHQTNLTNHSGTDRQPSWSPDGTMIAFASDRSGNYEVRSMNADGSHQTNLTGTSSWNDMPDWGT